MSLALGCGWEESNLQFRSHPGYIHFTDYDTFNQTNHTTQLLWVIIMYWHAQNAGEPNFVFWEILMVLAPQNSSHLHFYIFFFICRCPNELKF